MSRDFLIEFSNNKDAVKCQSILESYTDSKYNERVFNIDNRGDSLFVEIIYSHDINSEIYFKSNLYPKIFNLKNELSFVAIKNGEHNGIGYLTGNFDLNVKKQIKLTDLNSLIKEVVFSED